MALKFILEEKPTDHADLYKEEGGKWILDVEGAEPASRVAEFRTNNITLQKKVTDLERRFKDVDPEKYAELLTRETELMTGEVYKKEGLEKALEAKTAAMRTAHQKSLDELNATRVQLESRLAELLIDGELAKAGAKMGVRAESLPLLSLEASRIFRVVDGNVTAFAEDGKTTRFGPTGAVYAISDYLNEQAKARPFLFADSSGSGNAGGGKQGGSGDSGENPWKQGQFNRTKQHEILSKDPAAARRLMAAAGVPVPK